MLSVPLLENAACAKTISRSRSTERSSFTTERKVVLPSTLVAEFEKIARPNTDLPPYGIETCGILAGRLVS